MHNQRGQTLIEVLAVLTIAVVVISTMTVSVITSLSSAQYSKNKTLATDSAQAGLEILRQMKTVNWNSFKSLNGSYCLAKSCTTLASSDPSCWIRPASGCGQNVDLFIRDVTIEQNSSSCAQPTLPPPAVTVLSGASKVTVAVSWRDSKCGGTSFCENVNLVSCFSDYNTIPTP